MKSFIEILTDDIISSSERIGLSRNFPFLLFAVFIYLFVCLLCFTCLFNHWSKNTYIYLWLHLNAASLSLSLSLSLLCCIYTNSFIFVFSLYSVNSHKTRLSTHAVQEELSYSGSKLRCKDEMINAYIKTSILTIDHNSCCTAIHKHSQWLCIFVIYTNVPVIIIRPATVDKWRLERN